MDILKHRGKSEDFIIENDIVKGAIVYYDVQNESIGQILFDIFSKYEDYSAWTEVESGMHVTYAQMKDNCIRLALWMKQQGIGSGDIISSCSPNCLNNYVIIYATLLIGAVFNPWHHEYTLESVRYAFKLTHPKIIFACSSIIDTINKAAKLENADTKIICYDNHPNAQSIEDFMQMQKKKDVESFAVRKIENPSSELAGLLFSSGTSGPPKCVMITYQSLLNIVLTNATVVIKPNDVMLWYSTPYWIVGTVYMLSPVLRKAKVVICKNFDFEYICQIVKRYQVNTVVAHPDFLVNLYKNKIVDRHILSSLTRVFVSASKLSQDTAIQFRTDFRYIKLYQGYGMTEHGLIFMQTKKCKNPGSVGHIVPNTQVKIVDLEIGNLLGPNKQGEICCKSSMMTAGYYNNPVATSETIDKEGWLHTGDIGYYDENGEFFIVDRIKSVIRFRYHHVYPSEIAEVLLSHPQVLEVGITSYSHEEDVEHAIAFVKKVPEAKVTEEELVELSATLGFYKKLWGGVKFLDELPRTASGKVATNTLKEMAKSYAQN